MPRIQKNRLSPPVTVEDAARVPTAASMDEADDGTGLDPALDAGEDAPAPLRHGAAIIRQFWEHAPVGPGVYRMIGADHEVLYVGKAKNVRKRIASYLRPAGHTTRIARMIALTASMVFVSTETETEALLLETNLIKQLKPRFNVLMRDDKSFPYILLTGDHAAPQITKHRGARNRKGAYFGPFASVLAVNRTLNALQRAFLLRSCSDSFYANRTRPCLLYQIKRCSAPCTGEIAEADYAELVREAHDFLSGKSRAVRERLASEMTEAANQMEFERAAAAARPHCGALGRPGRSGHQSQDRRRGGCFCHCRGSRTVLRRSLFLPHLPELGQSRLFSARRQKPRATGSPRLVFGAVLCRQTAAAPHSAFPRHRESLGARNGLAGQRPPGR